MPNRRVMPVCLGVAAVLVAGAGVRLTMPHSGAGGWAWPEGTVFELRASRVAAAAAVGAALALAGALLQTLMRNPLASPALLGLSSGASLGVTLAAYLGFLATGSIAPTGGEGYLSLAAIVGCTSTLGLVYALAQRRGFLDPVTLVLVGVVVSIVAGGATQIVQRLLPDGGVAVARRLVGTVRDDTPWSTTAALGLATIAALATTWSLGPSLDAMSLDEDEARSVGVAVGSLRIVVLVASGLLAAGSVVVAGPIGFVGLVAPHAVRLLLGPTHRPLLIATPLLGAAAIVWADVLVASIALPSGRLPIGAITAIVGGPVFIVLLRNLMTR